MLPGIFAKTFARPTVEEVFDAVVATGLRCVQFNFACAGLPTLAEAYPPALLENIRRAAGERQITIAAVSGTWNMIHPDPVTRRAGLERLDLLAPASQKLGATLITLCTGTRHPHDMWQAHPDNDSPAAWRDLLATMEAALLVAERWNLTLGVEPEINNVVNSAAKARQLLDTFGSSRLKIVFDAANLIRPGDVQRDVLSGAFDLLGRDLALVHAKELTPDGHAGALALGAGVLDWEHYFSLVRASRFEGPVIAHGFGEADAVASAQFLQQQLRPTPNNNR